ncbi:MAG: MerR family transcriptional regulator [Fimbriimonadaceae bacterium]
MAATHSINAVSKATGLSAHTIRAWEKRYNVTAPQRTSTNRRIYSEADIEKLTLLKHAVDHGHSISMIAQSSIEELRTISRPDRSAPNIEGDQSPIQNTVAAMMALDSEALESELSRTLLLIGADRFVAEIAIPLVAHLDAGWQNKTVSIAQEHLMSALLRTQLDHIRTSIKVPANAPKMLVTTPSGQMHELGALIAAISAARLGWRVTYLGPNLPASEIATAAISSQATVIGLSLVYPLAHKVVINELEHLRNLLPTTTILIGGRATFSYSEIITKIGATSIMNEVDFQKALESNK